MSSSLTVVNVKRSKAPASACFNLAARNATNSANWYDSNLLYGNLKKYHTRNIGYSEAQNDTRIL